ncbi:hypothetical protein [Roseimicrobium sp. ORNL1]|uniref:hypothetical protein n=1 Tax=Roseimicrobium sp. ORNL1 TaxID=2711231 RepID=UPI0013E1EC84|nr:hypothetical protein [Roseimicrobium sp. ORNL1]QIF03644.1 hypothetical protein G5S37_19660 [Roseimicrobium sp. ORNL1]
MKTILGFLIGAFFVWFYLHTPPIPEASRYYSIKEALFDVTVATPNSLYSGTAKMQYGGTVTFNGIEYHKFTFVFEPKLGMPDEYLFTRLTEDGIYARTFAPKKEAPEYPLVPFPLRAGNEWQDMINGYVRKNRMLRIQSLETSTKVYPQCVHIQSSGHYDRTAMSRTTVYAPDVGLVKMHYTSGGEKRSIEMVRKAG